jgi:site-specific DNA-methyltransferase (adenine-specific)
MFELDNLYNMDCMEGMKEIPDKYFQLAIVDPPYGINAPNMNMGTHKTRKADGYPGESTADKLRKGRLNQGSGKLKNRALNTMNCDWDFEPPTDEYFKELFRVSQNQIIWGGNYFNLSPTRGIAVWDKCQPWENFSQVELAWTSFDKPAALFRYSNTGGANKEKKIHPTQKPVDLYLWLLQKYAISGDKILDTHTGSASSLIACHKLGFNYIGFEISEQYYESAIKRLNDVKKQISLF